MIFFKSFVDSHCILLSLVIAAKSTASYIAAIHGPESMDQLLLKLRAMNASARRTKTENYDCIIIGAGPAGLIAAIYLQRYNRNALVIDNDDSRVNLAPRIRNLIGYPRGIPGHSLLHSLRRQASK